MDKVREFAKGRLLLRMEDTRAVGGWLGSQELLRGEILTVDEVVSRLNAINPEDLQRVARQLLREDNLSMSVVGPYRSDRQFRGLLAL
jgi:predicted Zn-dependent peptidase